MNVIKYPKKEDWVEILKRPSLGDGMVNQAVLEVLDDVKKNGDAAISKYTNKFDHVLLNDFLVTPSEFNEADQLVDSTLKKAIQTAKHNIEKFHSAQKASRKVIETTPGVFCWQKSVPIEKVGLYIPGGSAPLFSTVLMLGVPAKLAGCSEIILCTPPNKEGKVHPAILYTAKLIGLTRIYKIGGIQSIAAMAFGTETVPKVAKIFGPGNLYVTAAKQIVGMHGVAIDMPAGPSEVAIMADKTAIPSFIAADLLSQAEHGADSQVILFTCTEEILDPILKELEAQLEMLPRKEIARKALENSKAIILSSLEEMLDITNEYAPEHLEIMTFKPKEIAEKLTAGLILLGPYTPVALGDYGSGTNHVLPTGGFAKSFSGLSTLDFMRRVSIVESSRTGLEGVKDNIRIMTEAENLPNHYKAIQARFEK